MEIGWLSGPVGSVKLFSGTFACMRFHENVFT